MLASNSTGPSATLPLAMVSEPMRLSRIFTPEAMEKLRSSSNRSPSGRKAPSVMSKSPARRTVKTPLSGPSSTAAKMLPALSRLFSETTTRLPFWGE